MNKYLNIIIIIFLIVAGFSIIFSTHAYVNSKTEGTIVITGTHKIDVVPDVGSIYYSISKTGPSVENLKNEVASVAKRVDNFLQSDGIDKSDIKTTSFSIYPIYDYPNTGREFIGYNVVLSTELVLRDISEFSDMISGLTRLGVQNISNINLYVEDVDKVVQEVRIIALENAEDKARILEEELDTDLYIKDILFDNQNYGYSSNTRLYSAKSEAAISDINIEPGTREIKETVTVTYGF